MTNARLEEPQLKELRDLLDVCDDLRKIFGSMMDKENSFTIPQVVVVGNQSVGKSSLLELLSGFQLPAGTGIVTRCPIVLQIRRGPRERYEVEGEELPLQRFESALDYAQKRLVDNSCTAGAGTTTKELGVDVTAQCVTTRIEGPHNRDITLVDLPGIQYSNSDLTVKIKEIIREYIKNPAAIILLVSTCSSDPTATEALQCAREVDENQSRTVCILTKPDELRDDDLPKMTSLIELVEGRHESLKFPQGVFITKARGGSDDKKSIAEIRKLETNFFASHPHFNRCMASLKKAGHENLLNRVEELALQTMKSSLPKMQGEVSRELEKKEAELQDFDKTQFVDDDEQKRLIMSGIINKIIEALKANFEKQHGKRLNECLDKFEIDVMAITKENAGRLQNVGDSLGERDPLRPSGVVNQQVIESHCTEFITTMKEPAQELLDSIDSIVSESLQEVIDREVHTQSVREEVSRVSETFLRQFKREVAQKLKESFEFEDVMYFSQLTKFYGPTVELLENLKENFTFSAFLEDLTHGELALPAAPDSSTGAQGATLLPDFAASNTSLNSSDEPEKNERKKRGDKKPNGSRGKDKEAKNNFSSYAIGLPNGLYDKHARPQEDHRPGRTQRILQMFVFSSKSSSKQKDRVTAEAESLLQEHETLQSTLKKHHYLTGFRVCGNVGKLLLYHFRRKMPSDLRIKLECNMNELCDSLNPDQEEFQRLKSIQSDIKQLQEAKDKLRGVMRSTKN